MTLRPPARAHAPRLAFLLNVKRKRLFDGAARSSSATVHRVPPSVHPRLSLVEFPADDVERARSFWGGVLDTTLEPREADQGEGWHAGTDDTTGAAVGVHLRGRGPGDSFSLPYLEVDDIAAALGRVEELGGAIVHPGERWAICKDSEGNPFGLASAPG